MKKVLVMLSSAFPAIAYVIAVSSAQAACWFFVNQPDVPEALSKYDDN